MKIRVLDNNYYIMPGEFLKDRLENHIYIYDFNNFSGPFLTKREDFTFPSTIYSNDSVFINHVIKSLTLNFKSTGLLFKGKKGLGKTLTSSLLATKLQKTLNLPIILVNREISKKENFFDFLNTIEQDFIIYIDEFEKLFARNINDDAGNLNQSHFLSFLDGINSSSYVKIILLTSNNDVNDLLMNRPGRIRYVRNYDILENNILNEIIDDKLIYKKFTNDLLKNLNIRDINIDIVIKIIDEINIHNKPFSEFSEFFNYTPSFKTYSLIIPNHPSLVIKEKINGKFLAAISEDDKYRDRVEYNLLLNLEYESNSEYIDSLLLSFKLENISKDKYFGIGIVSSTDDIAHYTTSSDILSYDKKVYISFYIRFAENIKDIQYFPYDEDISTHYVNDYIYLKREYFETELTKSTLDTLDNGYRNLSEQKKNIF